MFTAAWIADSCLASALVCVAIYVAIRPERPFAVPLKSTNWGRVRRISVIWLALWVGTSALAALEHGHWVRYRLAETFPELIAFVAIGPFQEEVLFRGSIFELAQRSGFTGTWPPVLVSTVFFSLHHFQLHNYAINSASLLQVGFTIPMGVVFGLLRAESASLWPSLAVHILTNLPGALGQRAGQT
jgi:membrane protease YdiL (CAAX protease family)